MGVRIYKGGGIGWAGVQLWGSWWVILEVQRAGKGAWDWGAVERPERVWGCYEGDGGVWGGLLEGLWGLAEVCCRV